jgi:hypothetical protein
MRTQAWFSIVCLSLVFTSRPFIQGTPEKTTVNWNTRNIDLGEIYQSVPVDVEYEVVNTGQVPLVITKAETGCNCAVTSYPKKPVQPNDTAIIKARFNAAEAGFFSKTINVIANTEPERTILLFHGEVLPQ